ncbi:MAG: hypothetical protein JSW56_02480, partial [Deltaproteobacteria bacterium]
PSAALPLSLVTAAYIYVRLIPRDFGSLASGHFPSASQKLVFDSLVCVLENKGDACAITGASKSEGKLGGRANASRCSKG